MELIKAIGNRLFWFMLKRRGAKSRKHLDALSRSAVRTSEQTLAKLLADNADTEYGRKYGFGEIRFPTFESTELFERGVGDTTDVVQKEMYTFKDKGDRSVTLRPEGTASAVRVCLEHGLFGGLMPLKAYYIISAFRYEKPQAGRFREFHQFGAELYGSSSPQADREVIRVCPCFMAATVANGGVRMVRIT